MSEKPKTRKKRRLRPFPRDTLEEALPVSQAIQDQNNGQPMKRLFLADHLKIKPGSSKFQSLLSSSFRYGLTKGSYVTEFIELTPLGQAITKAVTKEEKFPLLQDACQKVPVFKKFFQRYREARLPSDDYAKNLLRDEFNVSADHVDECLNLLVTNGRYSGLIRDISGTPHVIFEGIPPEEEGEEEKVVEAIEKGEAPLVQVPKPEPSVKQIFIAHGKNRIPLEQLKKILSRFKVPFKVAVDEPHRGRPISQKVADIMRSCTSAIFIFTADEETFDSSGNKIFRPSDNVVYELGAASALYGRNIVIFKEKGVEFASDFSDLGYIDFEKDNLAAKTTDLLGELIGVGLLKIMPA